MKRVMVIVVVAVIVGSLAFMAGSAYGKKSYEKKLKAANGNGDDTADNGSTTA